MCYPSSATASHLSLDEHLRAGAIFVQSFIDSCTRGVMSLGMDNGWLLLTDACTNLKHATEIVCRVGYVKITASVCTAN